MLKRNNREIDNIYRNGQEILLLYKNGTIIYQKGITFQKLIDKGYVTFGSSNSPTVTISANCPYSISDISDFEEVFNNRKIINTTTGVVGTGTDPVAFLWPTNHWLTDDELYTLYNNAVLKHYPVPSQFRYVNWKNKQSVTINYDCPYSKWLNADYLFGLDCPSTVNINLTQGHFGSVSQMFKASNVSHVNFHTGSTVTGVPNGSINVINSANATFEFAENFESVSGLWLGNLENAREAHVGWLFENCSKLTVVPSSMGTTWTPNIMQQTFNNCTSLTRIEPIIDATYVGNRGGAGSQYKTFAGCNNLTYLRLKNINAVMQKGDWDLRETSIDAESVRYIIDNVYTNVDVTDESFTYKNIYFPVGTSIGTGDAATLHQYGWNTYVGDKLIQTTK